MDQRHTNYYPQTKYLPPFLHLFLLNLPYYFFGETGAKIPLNRTQLFLLKPWSKQPKGYHHPYNQGFPTFTLPTVILHLVWPPKVSTSFSFVIPKIECLGRIEGSIKYYGQRWSGKLKNGISFLWAPCCINYRSVWHTNNWKDNVWCVVLDFWEKGAFLPIPFNMKLTWGDYSLASYLGLEKGTHEDFIFTENSFKFISCCFLIIKSTRFQLQHINLEHLEITLTKLMFIRATTT